MKDTHVQHDFDAALADLVRDGHDLCLGTISSAELGVDEGLAVGLEQLPDPEV